jgi:hypothetical protein
MIPRDRIGLICPSCKSRFFVRLDPHETAVPCPNPACDTLIDLASVIQAPDGSDVLRLSPIGWALVLGVLLSIVIGIFSGC